MAIRGTSRLSTRSEHGKAGSPYSAAILFVATVSVLGAAPVHAGEIDADVGYLASPVSLSVPGSQPVATQVASMAACLPEQFWVSDERFPPARV